MKHEIGKNLTIAIIWVSVAISAFPLGFGALVLAFFATIATENLARR